MNYEPWKASDYKHLRGTRLARLADLTGGDDALGDCILACLPGWRDAWGWAAPRDSSGRRWQYEWAVVNAGEVNAPAPVLDAGAHDVSLQFYYALRGCLVTSMDNSAGALRDAKRRAGMLALADSIFWEPIHADITRPIEHAPPEGYDCVFCISVLEHIKNWKAALLNLCDVTAEAGRLILTVDVDVPGSKNDYFDVTRLLGAVEAASTAGMRCVWPAGRHELAVGEGDGPLLMQSTPRGPITWAGLVFEKRMEA